MLTLENRPMDEDEALIVRTALELPDSAFGGRSRLRTYIGGVGAGVAGSAVLAAVAANLRGMDAALIVILACGLIGLGVSHILYRASLAKVQRARAPFVKDLEDRVVRDMTLEVADAVVIEEDDDEGLGCLMDAANRQLAFLHGQYLNQLIDRAEFPTRHVRVVRAVNSAAIVRFEHWGDVLRDIPTVPRARLTRALSDGDIIEGRITDLLSGRGSSRQ
jgi:hypothetical protein